MHRRISVSLLTSCRMCLARGRPFTVPLTRLIKNCHDWPQSDLADPQDGQPVSIAVMRKDLVRRWLGHHLIHTNAARTVCSMPFAPCAMTLQRTQATNRRLLKRRSENSFRQSQRLTLSRIESTVEQFFESWHATWRVSIGTGPGKVCESEKYIKSTNVKQNNVYRLMSTFLSPTPAFPSTAA